MSAPRPPQGASVVPDPQEVAAMPDLTVRPVTRDAVVIAMRRAYARQPRVFRLSRGQRRTIARAGAGGAGAQFSDGSGGKFATIAS